MLAGMNVNVWDVSDAIKALVRAAGRSNPGRLADPRVPLEELPSRLNGRVKCPPNTEFPKGGPDDQTDAAVHRAWSEPVAGQPQPRLSA